MAQVHRRSRSKNHEPSHAVLDRRVTKSKLDRRASHGLVQVGRGDDHIRRSGCVAIATSSICALLLTACGGGGGSPAEPAPVAAPAKHVTIYLDGDSTNVGYDPDYASGYTPTTPTMRMQADFDAALPGQVTVIAGAQLGNTFVWDVGGGGPNQIVPLSTRIAQLPKAPDIVISNSELNDQYFNPETASQYATDAYQWIQVVRAVKAIPIIEEPNPICASFANISVSDQFVFTMENLAAAASVSTLPVYAAFKAQPNWCTTLLSNDQSHPNDAGYAFKEAQYFATLLPIVQQILAR